jgi:ATP-dependent helicase/DNAse subunit B
MIRLSHSAKELYNRCPKAYFLHYYLNLRKKQVGSALPFGSAIDAGLETLVLEKDLAKAKDTFIKKWENFEINKKLVKGTEANLRYYKADLDLNLFKEDEIPTNHESLKRKGLMFLDAYEKQVLPKIKKVLGTQIPISIKNQEGDEIIGFIDLKCEWEDGRILIVDHKTSSKPYKADVIQTDSAQLATYGLADKEHDAVAYFVINKEIRKVKEPKVQIQTIIDKVPDEIVKKTIDNFDQVLYSIRNGHFSSNNPNCFAYGEECTCQLFEREGYSAFDYVGKDK